MGVEIKTKTLPMGFLNQEYSYTLEADVFPKRKLKWSMDEKSSLPLGVGFDNSGKIQGVPKSTGNYTLNVCVKTDYPVEEDTIELNLRIYKQLAIKNKKLEDIKGGSYNELSLLAEGGVLPYKWECDSLPAGMELKGSVIKGTPKVKGGLISICVKVTDHVGNTEEKYFTLHILQS